MTAPTTVAAIRKLGYDIAVAHHAGDNASLPDDAYEKAGATLGTAAEAWAQDMVVKVKEPIASEYPYLRDDLLLFTYLHLAADRPLCQPSAPCPA